MNKGFDLDNEVMKTVNGNALGYSSKESFKSDYTLVTNFMNVKKVTKQKFDKIVEQYNNDKYEILIVNIGVNVYNDFLVVVENDKYKGEK